MHVSNHLAAVNGTILRGWVEHLIDYAGNRSGPHSPPPYLIAPHFPFSPVSPPRTMECTMYFTLVSAEDCITSLVLKCCAG